MTTANDRRQRDIARLSGNMAGRSTSDFLTASGAGPIVNRSLDWFTPHPANAVFDSLKSPAYWRDLTKDLQEAGRIIEPVIALPDGTLIAGHSRIRAARELMEAGVDLGPVPTRIVDLPPDEAERRVYLSNLLRFELDTDTRLTLLAKVWPDYYLDATPGRPSTTGTVPAVRKKDVAEATGRSSRQVARDRSLIRSASKRAKSEGRDSPTPDDIRAARKEITDSPSAEETSSFPAAHKDLAGLTPPPDPSGLMVSTPSQVLSLSREEVNVIIAALTEYGTPPAQTLAERLAQTPAGALP